MRPELDSYLRNANPWWEDRPGRQIPSYRRWAFGVLQRKMHTQLAPVVVIRGARQVGKTTLQEQMIEHQIGDEHVEASRILRVQFDEIPPLASIKAPILQIARWFEKRILKRSFNEAATDGRPACLFLDEIQNLPDWAPQLKSLVDHNTVQVVVTGSSALRIEAGRDSLAGRITTLELGTLLLREIAGLRFGSHVDPLLGENGLESLSRADFWRELATHGVKCRDIRDKAFAAFSERGGYPLVHVKPDVPWNEVADQLNETVIKRVIQHDLRLGARGRKRDARLLEEVFRLACRYTGQTPGQAVFRTEIRQALHADVGWQRILHYLSFLDAALLIKLIPPLEIRLKKRKGQSKIAILDHGLRASWLAELVPLEPAELERLPHLSDLAGHLAESVTGAFLGGIPHLDLAHFPERSTEPEVDFILTVGEKRIPLEVKYRRVIDGHRDTVGLRSFIEKAHYNAPFGVLVTMGDAVMMDPRIIPVPLPSLLLMR